jgi:hypothetical protein
MIMASLNSIQNQFNSIRTLQLPIQLRAFKYLSIQLGSFNFQFLIENTDFSRFSQASIPSFESFLRCHEYDAKRTFPTPVAVLQTEPQPVKRFLTCISPTEPFRGAFLP